MTVRTLEEKVSVCGSDDFKSCALAINKFDNRP